MQVIYFCFFSASVSTSLIVVLREIFFVLKTSRFLKIFVFSWSKMGVPVYSKRNLIVSPCFASITPDDGEINCSL